MMPIETFSLDTISLWVCEKGPIREIVEIEFDVALDQLVREEGVTFRPGEVQTMHDKVMPAVFIELLDGRQVIIKKGEQYLLTIAGQRDLQRLMERHMLAYMASLRSVSHSLHASSPFPPTFPPVISFIHHVCGLVQKLRSRLFS